ncbi:hypothetical protein [Bradyrhizobium uaiense]|uniref:hypothetical protein n=1 Tax=Bradyrhizobium uaiense TaxID=2594946 RepID=UPI001F27B48E|nr:hypothetical protein [Bradyrhizobium uaiense]
MIKCAIAGLGRWGRALVEAAQSEPQLRIVSAVEPDIAGAASFCAAHGLSPAPSLEACSPSQASMPCCWQRRIRCTRAR